MNCQKPSNQTTPRHLIGGERRIMHRALRASVTVIPDPVTDRMARAIEAALPLIQDMWDQFPYAEQPGDDEVMTELRLAAVAYRNLQNG